MREGVSSGNASQAVDGTLKAGKNVAKASKSVLNQDGAKAAAEVAGDVATGIAIGISVKKTIDSAGRINNAKKAQKNMQKQIKTERKLIATKRDLLMRQRPDPEKIGRAHV